LKIEFVSERSAPYLAHKKYSSCPDLIRASINLRNKFFSKKMDHRVIKPGDDDLNGYDGLSWSSDTSIADRREKTDAAGGR
jgi:hypothetical protein